MQTVFEAAGGMDGLRRLADAWHRRVMANEVVGHAFSHGFHPQHVERLAAYWAEALGGPTTYSDSYGDETTVVKMHSGNGEHDEMDRRAIACFDQALADVGLADDGALRQVLHDYFAWATTKTCPATTNPPMMCLTASASHTGHGTDSRCGTPRNAIQTVLSEIGSSCCSRRVRVGNKRCRTAALAIRQRSFLSGSKGQTLCANTRKSTISGFRKEIGHLLT
jgi:hemoglobin